MQAGQFLRMVREGEGVTQQQMAGRLGVTQPAVSQIESSDDSITLATIKRYLAALDYSFEWPWRHR